MSRARRVLILHGWQGSGPDHWQTWLAAELARDGHAVRFPRLPECDRPCPDKWGGALHEELEALAATPGGERVVCCHSLGCVLWFREATRIAPDRRVDRVVLVAPPCPGSRVPELAKEKRFGQNAVFRTAQNELRSFPLGMVAR